MKSIAFYLSLALAGLFLTFVQGADLEYWWNIDYMLVYPDGVEKNVPAVNGTYPGPDIRGKVGQTVKIVVTNLMATESVTIHWHGIRQTGTPWSDGVPFVSQCPIGPAQSFVYEFVLDTPGTLWWHSHSGLQKSSLDGAIIIDGDEDQHPAYDDEETIIFSDWYHADPEYTIAGLLADQFRWLGNPQSMLMNGKGTFDCAETNLTCDPEKAGPYYLDVEPGKTYRIRLVGSAVLAWMNFGIEKHDMLLIETETTALKPVNIRHIDIGSGQTYSVLLKTKTQEELDRLPSNNGLFWMSLNMRHRTGGPVGFGVLRYSTNNGDALPKRSFDKFNMKSPDKDDVDWSLRLVRKMRPLVAPEVPKNPTRTFTFVGTQNSIGSKVVIALNNYSFVTSGTPVLHSAKFEIEEETSKFVSQETIPVPYDYRLQLQAAGLSTESQYGLQVFKVKKDEVVDFVFQNIIWPGPGAGEDEVHPWHLHLHDFWVLGYGDPGTNWTEAEVPKYNLRKAVYRNTFGLYPASWTAIRIKFDNPGAAIMHCHILPHLIMGMGFVVQIGDADDIPGPPPGTPYCGAVTKNMGPPVRNPFIQGGCNAY